MDNMQASITNSDGSSISQTNHYYGILDNLVFNLELLERVINTIHDNIDIDEDIDKPNVNKFHRNMIKKNKINRLSTHTYENIILPNSEEFFQIKDFLTNTNNKEIKRKYLSIKNSLYSGIIEAVNQGKSMDDILNVLNSRFSSYFNKLDTYSDESFINCSGFFYYMYFICDLGKNE